MRILTWNINGLTSALNYYPWSKKKSHKEMFATMKADIIWQEIKCQPTKLTQDVALVPGYDAYFSFSKTKPGYSGVAVYVKQPLVPLQAEEGITGILNEPKTINPCFKSNNKPTSSSSITTNDCNDNDGGEGYFFDGLMNSPDQLDSEGRCLILDFGLFVLLNIYFPNEAQGDRGYYKADYHACVRRRIDDMLTNGRQVILVGDLNAIHEPLDHFKSTHGWPVVGDTVFQASVYRHWLNEIIYPKGPLIDTCRNFHPQRKGMFTFWKSVTNERPRNFGVRLDYILVSEGLGSWLKAADILPELFGSDHCPVYIDLYDIVESSVQGTKCLMDLLSTEQSKNKNKNKGKGNMTTASVNISIKNKYKSANESRYSNLLAKNFAQFSGSQKRLDQYFSTVVCPKNTKKSTDQKIDQ
ncbi:hypothetical protein PHYBLDRAFT_140492 [Phycomyces blakesleeanus NRRL 1555(-)]|uniref:DNA-(apurinic or apyrimidinic site) endonuclease n=1 Tax=Phycomyces blakesleeanus (strain ATCC 8743b / DSM 1359 / FGSC 10004 / NBRC 33097 / NRRL 1555) TaxID=763407 RepID=A0A167PRE9_PHYB8|nr:hypothetical protein PHYBLDRAFT_140492 [Phycomyces blakesleeanus NRRL 1555(-)]OAD78399.1 hypothetical protein PHYBLDRAFT_140492 [Phycomyces blakesleeanus NRRL 1555(-)]|eukprot:XP_018296439.1 hypothetical protein PHYBLDRAFT_140492 [Phycomyces blakesleeanus NRRL 1555(-)]